MSALHQNFMSLLALKCTHALLQHTKASCTLDFPLLPLFIKKLFTLRDYMNQFFLMPQNAHVEA